MYKVLLIYIKTTHEVINYKILSNMKIKIMLYQDTEHILLATVPES